MALAPGTLIGAYRIESAIAAGGMGEVYLATDTRLDSRPVAIKFLLRALDSEEARHRFRREVSALSALSQHPHIVTVHEAGAFDGREYLVTEYVDGGTLSTWARGEKRNWRQVVELLIGVADALATAHDAGILHRDIKPDNILLTKNGYAKLGDFGLAKVIEDGGKDTRTVSMSPTRHGVILGTIGYLSPEQARGAALDARSDIFSFGIVLYEALSGRRPFGGATDLHVVEAVLNDAPAPLSEEIPPELRGVVEKALEKDPADRYQSMRDFVVDLRRVGRNTGTASTTALRAAPRPRRRWLLAGVAAVALIAVAGFWWRATGRESAVASPTIRSIAVLPLDNLSGETGEEYFSDGMTEQLISSLAQVRALKVISRTSVMQYKKTSKNLTEIGRELGVDAIIEGSVRRVGGRVRVTAQLIHAASDAHLWAKDFDHDFSDILKLQAEIAEAIVREIRIQVTPDEATRLAAARPVNPKAYEFFMLGRYHYWQNNPSSWKQSVAELEEAVRLQPDYAPAHAALSKAWSQGRSLLFSESEGSRRQAAQTAIELDPSLAEAHAALADIKFDEWDWQGALAGYQKAFELNPDSIDVCGCYANVLAAFGRFDEAIRIVEHAIGVNPLATDLRFNHGFVLFMSRKYADAERAFRRALELEPRNVLSRILLVLTYLQTNRFEEALAEADRPEFQRSGTLGAAYAAVGRRDDALKVLDRIDREASPLDAANVYFWLGDLDRAFEYQAKAIDRRQGPVRWMNVSPQYDKFRSDPRFVALVARLKLPDSSASR
jgi:serine/threonine protein kinase/tetratricopeptide (TPR) repeat protein